ncbi:hypothetical protein PGSY75_0811600 [Plasmodium gaboni]|uniref:Uncharacterized protein n=1 Tax=Plasmodium gaboni TaxID=647221 RepID=A0A151LNM4_9APIC|nr:hypothetical protein PGSY75_0811600 [Plasmodium gaboni]KYO00709.1 hypothetical protein PGSY75_0811600 [Plasmodium gaboni]
MNHVIIFLLLLINFGTNVYGQDNAEHSANNINGKEEEVEDRWKLYALETNPFLDLKHPNFNGYFVRSIDEYYVFETKTYNDYMKERYKNLENNNSFTKKQYHCALAVFHHGRPNAKQVNDYKIWSAPANILLNEIMHKKKYDKFMLYTPFVSVNNFLGREGLHSHVNFAFIIVNRLALTIKNALKDDTCHTYDLYLHGHCFGGNIIRIISSLSKDLWKIFQKEVINFKYEREALAIIDSSFHLTLKDINIVTDRDSIEVRKDPYFKKDRYYLYKDFKYKEPNKPISETFDDVFEDEDIGYHRLKDLDNPENVHSAHEVPDEYDNLLRPVKRLHFYLLNKKINLHGITVTGPPLSGTFSKMEDIDVGHQAFFKQKYIVKYLPYHLKRATMHKFRDVEEVLLIYNSELFCLLSIHEKFSYDYTNNIGSLMTFFKSVNFYSDLDNDEIVSMHASLALHSPLHMRSLTYYLLNIRNEYYYRAFRIPSHLSDINVSNNYPFFEYLKNNNVCSSVSSRHIEQLISYVNEAINFNQKPKPLIPQRVIYKSPYLEHFVLPYIPDKSIYTPHTILGTGRTYLLLYTFDIYKHIAGTAFNNSYVLTNDKELLYDSDPFIYYNWTSHVGDQNNVQTNYFMQDIYVYSDNVNMNIVDNLFNLFTSSNLVKFFIFNKNHSSDVYKSLYRTVEKFSLPMVDIVLRKQRKKYIEYPFLKNDKFNDEENLVYEYINNYTNYLKNFSFNNSKVYISNDNFMTNHETFKKYHSEGINSLKEQLSSLHKFAQENKTFYQMKKKFESIHNMNKMNSSNNESFNEEQLQEMYEEYDDFNNIEKPTQDETENSNEENKSKLDVNYHGIYLLIKRTLSLKEAFQSLKSYNSLYYNIKYIEFIIKNSYLEHVDDHISNIDDVSSCLFNHDDDISLAYIAKYCNYNQRLYFNIKKNYISREIYTVPKLKYCEKPKYKHLKICENSILLKFYFRSDLETILSNINKREFKRLTQMKESIETGIDREDIFSLTNDSLVTLFHQRNDDITNLPVNACFKVSSISNMNDFFFKKNNSENSSTVKKNSNDLNDNIFCTQVTLPVILNKLTVKSINDIYLRAISNVMKYKQFKSIFQLADDEEPYDSFIYFFDKFTYIYNVRTFYENYNEIETFNTPQNLKWNYFYYLLKNGLNTDYNNERFLQNFFYGEHVNLVKPLRENILKNFLKHFTVFFYLFKVDE